MPRWMRPLFVAMFVAFGGAEVLAQEPRDIGVVSAAPVRAPLPAAAERAHAGFFFAAREFPRDERLRPLDYAVDDAIAVAHHFAVKLRLLRGDRTVVLLGGAPATPAGRTMLEELKSSGCLVGPATKNDALQRLREVAGTATAPEDLVVAFFATHGFEDRSGAACLVPLDGSRADLDDTSVRVAKVVSILSESKAQKRLLLLDACRNEPLRGARGDLDAGERFHRELDAARGVAILKSCSAGEVSFEDSALAHGVFTHCFLEALNGRAPADGEGLVRLGAVFDVVREDVLAWSKRRGSASQSPSLTEEGGNARYIPLAVDPKAREAWTALRADADRLLATLKTKIERNGPFGYEECARVDAALATAVPGAEGRNLVQTCRAFVDGALPAAAFASFVATLRPGDEKPDPALGGDRTGEDPGLPVASTQEERRRAAAELLRNGTGNGGAAQRPKYRVPQWATVVVKDPSASVIKDASVRESLRAQGLPWHVRHTKSGIELRLIPPGSYLRGSPEAEMVRREDEGPQHLVTFTKPLYVATTETPREVWAKAMGRDPSRVSVPGGPVDSVSWKAVQEFLSQFPELRLPTEAEWEYACRAGSKTAFAFGGNIDTDQVNYYGDNPYEGGRKGRVNTGPLAVGSYPANAFGLHEMPGNLWEWCQDAYRDNTYRGRDGGLVNPEAEGGAEHERRVLRGGSYQNEAHYARSASRWMADPKDAFEPHGFRVVANP